MQRRNLAMYLKATLAICVFVLLLKQVLPSNNFQSTLEGLLSYTRIDPEVFMNAVGFLAGRGLALALF